MRQTEREETGRNLSAINSSERLISATLPEFKNGLRMFLLIRYSWTQLFYKNRTFFQLCCGIYFCAAHEPKVGYGLSAYFFLMMKHKALGGSSETLSSFFEAPFPQPVPQILTDGSLFSLSLWLSCSLRLPRSLLKVWAQRTLMAEQRRRRLIYAGTIFH